MKRNKYNKSEKSKESFNKGSQATKVSDNKYNAGKVEHGRDTSSKRINDASWYVANPQLAKDAASIPYSVFNGVQYQLMTDRSFEHSVLGDVLTGSQPGIYIYKYIPFPGETSPTSALNMSMRALYTYVRHANAGHANYEAPDLMMYILAMDSIYLMIHEVIRFIRLAYAYNIGNRLIPLNIFRSMGIDHIDLTANLANYRSQINQIVAKVNTLAVPADFDLFRRRAVLGSSILTDEPNKPTQIIVPKSTCYYEYDPTGTTGGYLIAKPWLKNAGSMGLSYSKGNGVNTDNFWEGHYDIGTLQDAINKINDALSILLGDEDINIMSGDILKAYGNDKLYSMNYVDENMSIEFSHDEELLSQFANSTVIDMPGADIRWWINDSQVGLVFPNYSSGAPVLSQVPCISQKDGTLKCHAWYKRAQVTPVGITSYDAMFNNFAFLGQAPLRAFKDDISPEATLERSRLTMLQTERNYTDEVLDTSIDRIVCGTEIGLGWLVYTTECKDLTVEQWFQFGCPNVTSSHSVNLTNYSTVMHTGFTDIITSDSNQWHKPCVNSTYVDNAVKGLSFGPLNYPITNAMYHTTGVLAAGRFTIHTASEKCALVDGATLSNLHDTAILGLLRTVYINK